MRPVLADIVLALHVREYNSRDKHRDRERDRDRLYMDTIQSCRLRSEGAPLHDMTYACRTLDTRSHTEALECSTEDPEVPLKPSLWLWVALTGYV